MVLLRGARLARLSFSAGQAHNSQQQNRRRRGNEKFRDRRPSPRPLQGQCFALHMNGQAELSNTTRMASHGQQCFHIMKDYIPKGAKG